jgi:hypothetical protein
VLTRPARIQVHTPNLNHIGLWIDNLDECVAWLKSSGVRFAGLAIHTTSINRRGSRAYPVCCQSAATGVFGCGDVGRADCSVKASHKSSRRCCAIFYVANHTEHDIECRGHSGWSCWSQGCIYSPKGCVLLPVFLYIPPLLPSHLSLALILFPLPVPLNME